MIIVRVPQDLIRDERVWLRAGDYEFLRTYQRGYVVIANEALDRQLARIPFNDGSLIYMKEED
jgi:hypothetical protein